jgi:hypothetical protein
LPILMTKIIRRLNRIWYKIFSQAFGTPSHEFLALQTIDMVLALVQKVPFWQKFHSVFVLLLILASEVCVFLFKAIWLFLKVVIDLILLIMKRTTNYPFLPFVSCLMTESDSAIGWGAALELFWFGSVETKCFGCEVDSFHFYAIKKVAFKDEGTHSSSRFSILIRWFVLTPVCLESGG